MKTDVEEAELLVFIGAAEQFASGVRPAMLIEIFAPWETAFGYGPWEPLDLLQRLGYQFLFASPAGLVAHTPPAENPFSPAYVDGYNVVAISPAHHTRQLSNMARLLGTLFFRCCHHRSPITSASLVPHRSVPSLCSQ